MVISLKYDGFELVEAWRLRLLPTVPRVLHINSVTRS